jgi:apolipoprotein N-acyltransferase
MIIKNVKEKWLILLGSILAGLVLASAFPPQIIPHLQWFALAPILALLLFEFRPRQLFFFAWVAFTAALCQYLWWYFDILPLNWLNWESTIWVYGLVGFSIFLTAGYMAIVPALFLLLVKKIAKSNIIVIGLLLFIGWPVFEYLRTFSYSLHPYIQGPGNIFGDHMGFMLLSYTLGHMPELRQIAGLAGEYWFGVIVLIPNLVLLTIIKYAGDIWLKGKSFTLKNSEAIYVGSLIISFILLLVVGHLLYMRPPLDGDRMRVAIIQTDFSIRDSSIALDEDLGRREKQRESLLALTDQVLSEKPDVVIMPEGMPSIFNALSGQKYPDLTEIESKIGSSPPYRVIIDSGFPTKVWDSSINPTTIFDNQRGFVGTYVKRFLMPWGEYTPYFTDTVSKMFGFNWRDYSFAFKPGKTSGIFETGYGRFGLLTCSEVLSSRFFRELAEGKVELVILTSSDAILHGSDQVKAQNLAMAQIRAAALRKPLVYASNGGRSFALDARGDIIWLSDQSGTLYEIVEVMPNTVRTYWHNFFP